MSGSLLAFAIPTSPLVDQRGMLTTAWYRFFLSLVARTGGTAGRVTPNIPGELVILGDVFGTEASTQGVPPFNLGEMPATTELDWWPQDNIQLAAQTSWLPESPPQEQNFSHLFADPAGCWAAPFWPSADITPRPPVVGITPGASPYTYEAPARGFVLVTGGTVSSITWTRDGSTFLTTGMTAGFFPVEAGDAIVVTYTVAPTMNLLGSIT